MLFMQTNFSQKNPLQVLNSIQLIELRPRCADHCCEAKVMRAHLAMLCVLGCLTTKQMAIFLGLSEQPVAPNSQTGRFYFGKETFPPGGGQENGLVLTASDVIVATCSTHICFVFPCASQGCHWHLQFFFHIPLFNLISAPTVNSKVFSSGPDIFLQNFAILPVIFPP